LAVFVNKEHKMFEACKRQEDFNSNINLKSSLLSSTIHNCIAMHGTKKSKELVRELHTELLVVAAVVDCV